MDGGCIEKLQQEENFFSSFYGGEAHDIASTPVKNLSSGTWTSKSESYQNVSTSLTKPFGNPLNIDS